MLNSPTSSADSPPTPTPATSATTRPSPPSASPSTDPDPHHDSTDYVPNAGTASPAPGTYLRKGRYITVHGALRHHEWTDRSGTRARDYIVAHHVHFDPAGADRGESEPNGTRHADSAV